MDIIVTDRITLRLWSAADAEAIFAVVDRNRRHLRQWLPWLDANTRVEHTRESIQSKLPFSKSSSELIWGIWQDSQLLGVISYNQISVANRYGVIGYWLDADASGNGTMTKSCRAVIDYGFDHLHLNRIEIACAEQNILSRAIPERLGFQKEGVVRQKEWLYDHFVDHVVYSLLLQEWR